MQSSLKLGVNPVAYIPPLSELWLLEDCGHDIRPVRVAHDNGLLPTILRHTTGDVVNNALQAAILQGPSSKGWWEGLSVVASTTHQ